MSVVIETTIGDITVDLFTKERPTTCLNFLKLCKVKYYNLCLFHKVERNFIAQSGDPSTTGRGGESIFSKLYGDQAKYFEAELKPRLKHEKMGTLSMVNNGNNMNGSQFFITLGENLTYLDEVHTVFGEVAEGIETLLKINEIICDQNDRPYQDIRITHTVILHDPYDDPSGLEVPDASPEPTKEMLETDYIAPDEEIDDTKGKNVEEIEEKIKDSEAKARATILEMVGDIPDADVKPPENVLFVCKLNPVTTSEDLELIFSRFGSIISCEVIKDRKSGESLQYAFIEFEKEEDCENAYFKMDNVLIDDRRIHVDFSQSVSKMNWNKQYRNYIKGKSQNWAIKDKQRKSDGYEMIFDNDSDHSGCKQRDKYEKKTAQKNKSYDSSRESRNKRGLSNSADREKSRDSRNRSSKSMQYHSRIKSPEKSYEKSEFRYSRSSFKPLNSKSTSNRTPSYSKIDKHSRHDSTSSDSSATSSKNSGALKNKEKSYKSSTSLEKPQYSIDKYSRTSSTKVYSRHDSSSSDLYESVVKKKKTYDSRELRYEISHKKEESSYKEKRYSSPSRSSKHLSSKKTSHSHSRSTSPAYKSRKSVTPSSNSGSESPKNYSSKKTSKSMSHSHPKSMKKSKEVSKSELRKLHRNSNSPQEIKYRKKKSSEHHSRKESRKDKRNVSESSSDSSDSDLDSHTSKKKSKSSKSRHDHSKKRTRDHQHYYK